MRDILFKAKRLDNGEWVEGDLQQDKDLETACISGYEYCYDLKELQRESFYYAVYPKTVSQYLGIKDKNGQKIFDTDIVRLPKCKNDVCIFVSNGCNYYLKGKRGHYTIEGFRPFESVKGDSFIVIGNIFDNPELVE